MPIPNGSWDELVDRWVRVKSRKLDDASLLPRKLLHTSQIVAVWPLLRLDRALLLSLLTSSCLIVIPTQRRIPYATAALLTLSVCTRRLAVGGAWVVFTTGDGLAAILGRRLGGPPLPWNETKSWAGSLGFAATASLALFALLRQEDQAASQWRSLWTALAASLSGAIVESLDLPLDDNYSVIVVAGAVLELLLRLRTEPTPVARA